jgi:hypothetical protein
MVRGTIYRVLPLALALGAAGVGLGLAASSSGGCDSTVLLRGMADAGSEVAAGESTAVLVQDRIAVVDEDTGAHSYYARADSAGGVAQHIAAASGQGTAYVADVAGNDIVVAVRSEGVTEIPALGEAAHPAWSGRGELVWADDDLRVLRIRSFRDGSLRTVVPPKVAIAVFSPVFEGSSLVAIVQEPQPGASAEDATIDNLWRYDLAGGRWTKLTSFTAEGSMWTAIRTPVVQPDGSIAFVRVRGDGQATGEPTFELWRLAGGVASRLRSLPGEAFLAGSAEKGLLWNTFDGAEWRLALDRGQDLGCGAVRVDPRTEPDPDLAPEDEGKTEPVEGPLVDADLAVLVGDFASEAGAARVAGELGFQVIGHSDAPGAVAPETWAAVSPLDADANPEAALAAFRAEHPEYADRSWIVSLAGTG